MKYRLALLTACLIANVIAPVRAATVYVSLTDFGTTSLTNRRVIVTGNSLPRGASGSVAVTDRKSYTVTNSFYVSNAIAGVYLFEVQAPPSRTEFRVLVPDTNGLINASENLVASPNNTYPPDTVAWGAAASDARYARLGTIGSGDVTYAQWAAANVTNNAFVLNQSSNAAYLATNNSFVASLNGRGTNTVLSGGYLENGGVLATNTSLGLGISWSPGDDGVYISGDLYADALHGSGHLLTGLPLGAVTNAGTMSYSNASAFLPLVTNIANAAAEAATNSYVVTSNKMDANTYATLIAAGTVQTNISHTSVTNEPWLEQTNGSAVGLNIIGNSDSGTMSLGTIGSYGISPYFTHIQYRSDTAGGHLFMDKRDGYNLLTLGYNANTGAEEKRARTYWEKNAKISANGDQNIGASATTYFPALGGSAAALADMPARGNEIWASQRFPAVIIASRGNGTEGNNLTNCTQINMSNSISSFVTTNALAAPLASAGVRLAYDIQNGWLDIHRGSGGLLGWNTNRFPMQTVSYTNVAHYLRTNGFEAWLMMYADSMTPTTNNTEIGLDPVVGNSSAYWHYPQNATPFGAYVESQPMITPRSLLYDVSSFYAWGISGLTLQDTGSYETAGYQEQLRRMFSYSSLYPTYVVEQTKSIQTQRTYRDWYPNAGHALVLNYLYGANGASGAVPFPVSVEYDANGVAIESNGEAQRITDTVLGRCIGVVKPQISILTNWLAKTIKYIPQSDGLVQNYSWTSNDWRHYMELCATFDCNAVFTSPHYYFTNANFQTVLTNAAMLSIWQDYAQERVSSSTINGGSCVFGKRLADGGAAVWMVNEGNTASNLTINLASLRLPTTIAHSVTEVWSGTAQSNAVGTFTAYVQPTNTVFLRISPVFTGNGGGLTNVPGSSIAIGAVALAISVTNVTVDVSVVNLATNLLTLTCTTNVYFAQPSNLTAGKSFMVDIRQDATGSRTVTFNTNYWKFPSAQILTTTTNANAWSLLSCVVGQYATNVAVIQSLNFQ